MYNIINLAVHRDERGDLVTIENSKDIPFSIKRVFYIFNINQNAKRAQHANMVAQELIICLSGSCKIKVDDGKGKKVTRLLNSNNESVHIEPKIWLELSDFSENCILLVMSDHLYCREHQIRDYKAFTEAVK